MSDNPDLSRVSIPPSLADQDQQNQSTKKLTEEKQKRLDMGPRWSEEELDIFLKYFRQSGLKDVTLMKEELEKAGYKRSIDNLTAVFMKNKNFLTFAPSCTARDLNAIMADHYETMEAEIQIAPPERPPAKSREPASENTTDKKRNVFGLNPKGVDFLDEPMKNRAFEESLNHKRKHPKFSRNQSSSDESVEAQSYKPKKVYTGNNTYAGEKRKQRKSLQPKGKFPLDFDFNEPELLKNAEVWSRTCPEKNKRSRNFSLRKSTQDKNYSFNFLKFLDCEVFYSTLDEPYFAFNNFAAITGGEKGNRKLKETEWNVVRNCLGKPRRFSNEFIKSQLQDLNAYRNLTRNYLFNRTPLHENKIHPVIAQQIKGLKPLQVSQIVLAVHPQCNHIHAGSILTITGSHVIIKFFPTELGAMSVSDTKVRTVSQETATQIMDYFNGSNLRLTGIPMNRSLSEHDGDKAAVQNRLIQDLDFSALSLFVKIMERKTVLVNELKNFNDQAENGLVDLDDMFYQEYGWTGVQIKLLDNALKHVVTKTRLRGLNNYDINQISNNLDILMANPLKALAELERRSNEDVDPKVIKEIKGLLHKSIEQKINEQIKGLTEKYAKMDLMTIQKKSEQGKKSNGHEEKEAENNGEMKMNEEKNAQDTNQEQEEQKFEEEVSDAKKELKNKIVEDVDEPKKKDLKKMVDNMVGVILSLKLSGDLNMTENRYLTDLHNHIFEGNSDEFHEINTVLLNICSK